MEPEQITLELLVRSGNVKGVEQFVKDDALKKEKTAEAGIYSAIKFMRSDECSCGIDSEAVCTFLGPAHYNEYFSKTANVTLLNDLLKILYSRTKVMMEAYAQITPFDVLGMESVAGAMKRNLDAGKEPLTELVQSGYDLVFCPHDIEAEMVERYFPLIDQFRFLVNPVEIVTKAAINISELDDLECDYRQKFAYAAIDKCIQMTDKETVSKLLRAHCPKDVFDRLVKDGKALPVKEKSRRRGFEDAVQEYENELYPSEVDAEKLAKHLSVKGRVYVGQKMAYWFKEGKMRHLMKVVDNEKAYDEDIARKVMGIAIEEAVSQGQLAKLDLVLRFPEYLIDKENPSIACVVKAYEIAKSTEEK